MRRGREGEGGSPRVGPSLRRSLYLSISLYLSLSLSLSLSFSLSFSLSLSLRLRPRRLPVDPAPPRPAPPPSAPQAGETYLSHVEYPGWVDTVLAGAAAGALFRSPRGGRQAAVAGALGGAFGGLVAAARGVATWA